jgi:subtilase family serine protease
MDSKDYVDADIGNPIVIGSNALTDSQYWKFISKHTAEHLNLKNIESSTNGYVWVDESEFEVALAKEAIKRKEEMRMVRARSE